jgi:flagellar hook-associated protein 2
MGTTSTSFTGGSAFSAQFQQVIAKAISAASQPMQQLQSQESSFTNQQSELQRLSAGFGNLQAAIDSINTATGLNAYSANVDNSSVASASVTSGVLPGTYSVNVINTGTRTNTISGNGLIVVTNPSTGNIDSSSGFTLTVNGQSYQITDPAGSLNGLAQAINSSGASVQATIVNVGGSSSPDYRLSIQGLDYAPDSIQLNDGTNDLLSSLATGSYVEYQVNGQPSTPINSVSRTVTLSPGLSVNLLQAGTTDVTVSQNGSGIGNSLSSFVNTYNSIVDELGKNRGQNGGALAGQSIVYQLQNALQNLAHYSASSGNLSSLAALGITFDQNGHLQFDQSTFADAATGDVLNFLGSESVGGFLQAAQTALTSINDTTTGILPNATQSISITISTISNRISDDQQQLSHLQQRLTAQMSAADAMISSLEQQVTQITDLFNAMEEASKNIHG